MGPIWGRQDPGCPHVGPMNLANWVFILTRPPGLFQYMDTVSQYQCGNSHCGDGMLILYLHNGISYTRKIASVLLKQVLVFKSPTYVLKMLVLFILFFSAMLGVTSTLAWWVSTILSGLVNNHFWYGILKQVMKISVRTSIPQQTYLSGSECANLVFYPNCSCGS